MKRSVSVLAALAAVVLGGVGLLAHVNGAIFTTISSGTTVNGNIYEFKEAVYLGGGPQNQNNAGLSPDGRYYFQVTDPSGAVLLSEDALECRVLVVANGRIAGAAPGNACGHVNGTFDAASGITPVQLMPYADTPNHGGEYKVWLTPVAEYGQSCDAKQGSHGFCDAWSKTDNFKVRASAPNAAQITVCKFNDYDANGVQGTDEPFIAHWPITASGVDGGTVTAQTGDDGCTTFTVSDFNQTKVSQAVVLTEGSFGPDWTQSAPVSCGTTPNCSIDGGAITVTVGAGDMVNAPNFGNTNPYCQDGCDGGDPIATANAYPSFVRTYAWTIGKSVDQPVIKSASSSATANYTVTVSHDAGTDSDFRLAGSIRVANPGATAISGMTVTAAANDGTCAVVNGEQAGIAAGSHRDFAYHCDFPSAPVAGSVSVTVSASAVQLSASAPFDFATATMSQADAQVMVTDSMVGELGSISASTPSPIQFNYSRAVSGQAGTCTSTNNVASFVTNTTSASGEASQSVKLCVGADLTAASQAATTFNSDIAKSVDRAVVQQQGGTVTFKYTITVNQRDWLASGAVTVVNPNDWQDVAATVAVTLPNATCTVATPAITVNASSSVAVPFSCNFAAAPPQTVTATATISWDAVVANTTAAATQTAATAAFASQTVLDAFNGGASTTLGTISAPVASVSFLDTRTVTNAAAGRCQSFGNVASISGTTLSASQTAVACNTVTGAHTIGFWQNKNGQGIITGSAATAGVCNAATWLRQFTPFQDLAANASCKTVASYATTIIKSASAGGATMNAMLKAQMLASALDVYFSDAALGGNALGAPTAVGGVRIDLAGRGAAFGNASSLTVMQMLSFQSTVSNVGGTSWYGNVKTVQELAKTAFDQINNEIAPIAR